MAGQFSTQRVDLLAGLGNELHRDRAILVAAAQRVNDVLFQEVRRMAARDLDHKGLKFIKVLANDPEREEDGKLELGFGLISHRISLAAHYNALSTISYRWFRGISKPISSHIVMEFLPLFRYTE
jgi:hypothetical protein